MPRLSIRCFNLYFMNNKSAEPIKTVLIIMVGMLVVYFITGRQWAVTGAIIIGILGLSSGYISQKIHYLWMKLSWVLGLIIPNILLSVIFFLVLTPLALLSRIFGEKDPLSLKNTSQSLFKETNKKFEKPDFEKTW